MAALASPLRVSGQDVARPDSAYSPLLSLPFVPQSEALCGGAALAMVLRYHGFGGVQAEDFAHLVVASGIGIRTTDLVDAARARGLEATPFTAERDVVRALLARAEPVIALIEDRPGVYHYVVLLAWGDGRVLFHDPAVGPHQVMREEELLRAWAPAGHWALRATGPGTAGAGHAFGAARAPDAGDTPDARGETSRPGRTASALRTDACDARLAAAAAAAARDDLASAERELAAAVCADGSLVARERAGLHFRQGRYDEALALAMQRVGAAPGDAYAWELLGAIRFVRGERDAALVAWNRLARPVNDLTQIDGLRRTPYPVAAHAIAIGPGSLVSAPALAHARRRLAAIPSVARARIDYQPISTDSVRVTAAVLERPVVPLSRFDLAVHGARALMEERVLLQPTNLLRLGEAWRVDATWEENRRSFALGLRLPRVLGLHAVTRVEGGVHDYAFAPPGRADAFPPDSLLVRESMRGVGLGLQDWASGALQWRAEVGLEEWTPHGTLGRAFAGASLHAARDRVILGADAAGWWGGATRFARLRVNATLHAPLGDAAEALVLVHGQLTGARAPHALRAGAGTGRVGGALLRAHPLLAQGVVQSRFWAPRLAGSSSEVRRWIADVGGVRLGAATFLDLAVADGALTAPAAARRDPEAAADAGIGLRLALPAGPTVRLDAAWSLATGAPAISAGWSVR